MVPGACRYCVYIKRCYPDIKRDRCDGCAGDFNLRDPKAAAIAAVKSETK
jgi:hypothetical protein